MSGDKRPAGIDAIREVVERGQCLRLIWPTDQGRRRRGRLLDHFTASAMLAVHSALSPASQSRFAERVAESPSWFLRMAEFSLKQIR
jgi:hypothetical protein